VHAATCVSATVTNFRRKKFRTTCFGFSPSLPPEQYLESARAVDNLIKEFNTSTSHKISLKILRPSFSDFAPIHINNHAYSLVAIYFEKTGHKHKWHKLYFIQRQTSDNNGLVFKCCMLHDIILRDIENPASCRIPGLLAVRNEHPVYSVQGR
jgi:hypothetical protein